jgi:pimeloyl-ACP methyl ester carboxylesterase
MNQKPTEKKRTILTAAVKLCILFLSCGITSCTAGDHNDQKTTEVVDYTYTEVPLQRNGINLHLDCMTLKGKTPEKNILLIHGVTYSSHEFDINYKNYSLVRRLAREGYAVWRLDITGFGQSDAVTDGFLPDSDYAADDFQKDGTGALDYSITDPVVIELFCSSCWHYDKESSPNGGRRDICVSETEKLIDLSAITVPTLVICGDKDPYLNYALVDEVLCDLPEGSVYEKIKGASHVAYIEAPFYQHFQNRIVEFLKGITQ